jgi:uncharacterized membrane protein
VIIINFFRKFLNDDNGYLVPMSVGFLPIILLFLSFSLDFGRVYLLKHQLQGATDAAALAGTSQFEVRLVFDSNYVLLGTKPVINSALADAEATSVFNQNIALTNLVGQGVTIVNTVQNTLDDTHYYYGVTADIPTYIAGPIMAMLGSDVDFNKLRVVRSATAKVQV